MLASVADSLKIWDCEESDEDPCKLRLRSNVEQPNDHFYSLSWNHTNQVIALGGKQPKINLVSSSGHTLSSLTISEAKVLTNPIRSIEFSHNSRLLACASGSPVQLWDLKRRQIKSVFTGHIYPVVSVCFNQQGDLFTGDCFGNLKLWNLKSNLSTLSLSTVNIENNTTIPPTTGLNIMKYSVNNSMLLCGYNDGAVRIFDFSSNELLAKVSEQHLHSDKITGISSSPRNPKLVTTASLDKKLLLIDTSSKQSSASGGGVCGMVNTEHQLTSVSFHENGLYTAAGSSDGFIMIYDWRHVKTPLLSVAAHHSSVAQLHFQNPRNTSSSASTISSKAPSTTHSNNEDHHNNNDQHNDLDRLHDHHHHDIDNESLSTIKTTTTQAHTLPPSTNNNNRTANTVVHNTTNKPSLVHSKINPNTTTSEPNTTKEAAEEQVSTARNNLNSSSSMNAKSIQQSIQELIQESKLPDNHNTHSASSKAIRSPNKHLTQHQQAVSEALNTSTSSDSRHHSHHTAGTGMTDSGAKAATIKEIQELLELLRYDIHSEVQDIIREQVRQFAIAKDETTAMFRELSMQLAELLKANKELRQENEKLRRIY